LSKEKTTVMLCEDGTENDLKSPTKATEWKYDGTRVKAEKHGNKVELINRHGVVYTARLPEIYRRILHLEGDCILDGEIVYMLKGKDVFKGSQIRCSTHYPDFWLMQQYPVVYKIFDITMLNGKNLEQTGYLQRKEILQAFLDQKACDSEFLHYVYHRFDSEQHFAETKNAESEGLIAKDVDSGYVYERSWHWLKIKNWRREVCDVVGYTAGKNARSHFFGSLVLAKDGVHRGAVGSGFGDWELRRVKDTLFDAPRMPVPFTIDEPYTAVKTDMQVRVKYYQVTENNVLRFPIFVEFIDS
jgi:ATP-dependent DNA ligase